ncbi:MAG: DUF6184 family natural product biosynthesis lipoprotein [Polyangiaceae bacterium]
MTRPIASICAGAVFSCLSICCMEHSDPPRSAAATTAPRTTAAAAVEKIAAARCEREARCQNVSAQEGPQDAKACQTSIKRDLDQDFGEDKDCRNGVNVQDLDECLAKIRGQECGALGAITEGAQRSMACSTMDLCMS